jgi:hypothetical protein
MVELPNWAHAAEHIRSRSARKGAMETNIEVEWANEAYSDLDAVTFDPDYASLSGKSARTIGWSEQAGFLITVITVREDGHLWGANAWRANSTDANYYNRS